MTGPPAALSEELGSNRARSLRQALMLMTSAVGENGGEKVGPGSGAMTLGASTA